MIFAQSYKNLSYLQTKKENFLSFVRELQYLCTLINQKYDMPQSLHIAIIGGGAAGFFAAKCSTSMPSPAASICRQPDHGICGGTTYRRIAYSSFETKSFTMRVYSS